MSKYSISEFAELTGYTQQTLRNWEKSGKLIPYRNGELGHRRYSQEQLDMILDKDDSKQIASRHIVGYFKVKNNAQPLEVNDSYNLLRKYTLSTFGQEFDILCDVYNENNRTVGLDNYNDILSKVTRHKLSDIVFLCTTVEDYYEYKAVSTLLQKLDVQVHLLKNNVLTKGVPKTTSLVELVSDLSESYDYSKEDIVTIVATLESNLDTDMELDIMEIE